MNELKKEIREEMIEKLKEMEDFKVYGCDLGYEIFEEANINGSFTCSSYDSIQWIKKYFDDFSEIIENIKFNLGDDFIPNLFENPEQFQVVIMLEVSNELIGKCPFVDTNWDEEIELNKQNIKIIIEELKNIY